MLRDDASFDVLTPGELEVVKLIAEAYTNVLDKLGMRDRVELARSAIRRGLIQP